MLTFLSNRSRSLTGLKGGCTAGIVIPGEDFLEDELEDVGRGVVPRPDLLEDELEGVGRGMVPGPDLLEGELEGVGRGWSRDQTSWRMSWRVLVGGGPGTRPTGG